MDVQQVVFLLILGAGLVLFITERFRVDVTAMLLLVALALTGILSANEALSGFSSQPALVVAAVFVLSGGLATTGVTDRIGNFIGRAAGKSEWRTIAVAMPAVAALAAFTHHLMITAMMLPILMRLAKENGLPPSRVLMPMSLAASLGTTLTVISVPAFLLAGNLLQRQTGHNLEIFSITPIGAALVLLGVTYMLLGRFLLPKRGAGVAEDDYLKLDQYYVELVVEADSRWHDRPLKEFEEAFKDRLQVAEWLQLGSDRNSHSRGASCTLTTCCWCGPRRTRSPPSGPNRALPCTPSPSTAVARRISPPAKNSSCRRWWPPPRSSSAGRWATSTSAGTWVWRSSASGASRAGSMRNSRP
ncbi:MAG: SLC13 family permease [Bryobacteraceae bacterium]